jgi:hypothetical protein
MHRIISVAEYIICNGVSLKDTCIEMLFPVSNNSSIKEKICNLSCLESITYNLMCRNDMKNERNVHSGYKVVVCSH